MAPSPLVDASRWKQLAILDRDGYYRLQTEDTRDVPVRLFLTPALLASAEDALYPQIINATRFPGVKLVAITPDTHFGYGVPVGSVLVTDAERGSIAMGPVGYDIGCGMMSARSGVPAGEATPEKRLRFNREVMKRVDLGAGGRSRRFPKRARSPGPNPFDRSAPPPGRLPRRYRPIIHRPPRRSRSATAKSQGPSRP